MTPQEEMDLAEAQADRAAHKWEPVPPDDFGKDLTPEQIDQLNDQLERGGYEVVAESVIQAVTALNLALAKAYLRSDMRVFMAELPEMPTQIAVQIFRLTDLALPTTITEPASDGKPKVVSRTTATYSGDVARKAAAKKITKEMIRVATSSPVVARVEVHDSMLGPLEK